MYNGKESQPNDTKQIILIKTVMQIEGVCFSKAIEIIDKLNEADLWDYYMNEMHKAEFEQLRYNEDR
jgi:hypothetical protein